MTTFRERWKHFKRLKLQQLGDAIPYNGVKARHEHTGLEIEKLYEVVGILEARIERVEDAVSP